MIGSNAILRIGATTVRHSAIMMLLAAILLIVAGIEIKPRDGNEIVLEIANNVPDGGGYCDPSGTGVAAKIEFKGTTILCKSEEGTHSTGFSFSVAMESAQSRGLLDYVEPFQISKFQREWYGLTNDSAIKQAIIAIQHLKIGREIDPLDAKPGDFIVFSRPKTRHSGIFLNWVRDGKDIVGVHYRSSQPSTNGVGNSTEYFLSSGYRNWSILPTSFYVARMY